MSKYSEFYKTAFGKKVLEREAEIVFNELGDCRKTLSIGCGPALLEKKLEQEKGLEFVGLEKDREMAAEARERIKVVEGSAESMRFEPGAFDCALFVTSLEFVGKLEKAVGEAARALCKGGKAVALVLNPASGYFKKHVEKKDSYFRKIKHPNPGEIRKALEKRFSVEGKYMLGIEGEKVFEPGNRENAALYVMKGVKK